MAFPNHSFVAVQSTTLPSRLSDELIRRIRDGDWPVRTSLPSKNVLCEQCEVSRHLLRHALKTSTRFAIFFYIQETPIVKTKS
jgi:DNA-binding FadR family transcriptional regulator